MSESEQESASKLARQARQNIASLRAAGIDWVPRAKRKAPAPAVAATALFPGLASVPDSSINERRQALEVLSRSVAGCTRCAELASTRTQTVFGVGKMDPELCFVGEAPGADEDAQGEPFVGAAGQLLNKIIVACKLTREEVYICNILKCRPPGNRLPLPNEAGNCREFLDKQIELIRPKYICCLGACAAQNLLQSSLSIGKMRGQIYDYRGIPVACTYHPAYLLRNPSSKKDVWADMKQLMARMGRPVE
jgi:uracil-DNA glycosylase family 4